MLHILWLIIKWILILLGILIGLIFLILLLLLFCPIRFASAALGPTARPTIRFTKIPTSATQLPTAASAAEPANLPTTATSAELNSCCRILLNASGIANRISLPASFPFSISISFAFVASLITDL